MKYAPFIKPQSMLVKTEPDIIGGYFQDHSGLKGGYADKLYIPENESELASILKDASLNHTHITISGAGTGVTGGRVPFGGAIVSLEMFTTLALLKPTAMARLLLLSAQDSDI